MRPMRVLTLPDIHTPYNINLKPIWKFAADFKPDVIVLSGDVSEWEPASHWIADQSLRLEGKSILKCHNEVKEIVLDPILRIPGSPRVVFMKGNHEDWLDQCIDICKNGKGYWELESNINVKKYHIEFVEINKVWRPCENLVYIHGIYTNEFHSKKTVQAYHTSVLYGHTHDYQVYIQVSPLDTGKFYKAASMGCLCNLNPHYGKNKPNRWVHGFNYAYVNEDTGFFNDTQVLIVKGGFWAMGKYYA